MTRMDIGARAALLVGLALAGCGGSDPGGKDQPVAGPGGLAARAPTVPTTPTTPRAPTAPAAPAAPATPPSAAAPKPGPSARPARPRARPVDKPRGVVVPIVVDIQVAVA